MTDQVYIGIDLGTTSVKCMAVGADNTVRASYSVPYASYSPQPGWVEQEPSEWMDAVAKAVRGCMRQAGGAKPAAVSFSGHMSSPVFLDEDDRPLMRCIHISDIRSARQTAHLMETERETFERFCGNRPLDCFAASKLLWFKEERPELYRRVRRFVFAKDYVRGQLTGLYHTDYTDAGNSLLFDFDKAAWHTGLIQKIGLDPHIFPEAVPPLSPSGFVSGEAARLTGLPEGTPVVCGAADMACSQLGTGALREDILVITLSTSGQMCMSVPGVSAEGIGRVTFHKGVPGRSTYAMASIFSGGLALNWAYQTLFDRPVMERSDFAALGRWDEEIAQVGPGAGGVCFLPFLTGSGSPYFNTSDRAALTGLSSGVTKAGIGRAVLEGVAYNIRENMEVFKQMGCRISSVRLGGGGTRMPAWPRIIADVLGCPLELLQSVDASAIGACILARASQLGEDSLLALSDSLAVCGSRVPCSAENNGLYDRLFMQYNRLCRFMSAYQEEQFRILSGEPFKREE